MKERIRVCVDKKADVLYLCYWNKSNEHFSNENKRTTPDFLVLFKPEKYFNAKDKGKLTASTKYDTKLDIFIGSHAEDVEVFQADDYDLEAFWWSIAHINNSCKDVSFGIKNGDIHTVFSDRDSRKANFVYF